MLLKTFDHSYEPAPDSSAAASTALRTRRRSVSRPPISMAEVGPTACSSFRLFGVVITKGCLCSAGDVVRITSSRSQLLE